MSKLVLIPSPIGNLSDITKRAIEEIENSDLIFCEVLLLSNRYFGLSMKICCKLMI